MNDNPILTYNNDGVLGTSDDELLVDDAGGLFGTAEPDAPVAPSMLPMFNGLGCLPK